MKILKTLTVAGCLTAAGFCSTSFAQEEVAPAEATSTIAMTQDGSLKGKVFTEAAGVRTPLNAKVTLSSEGVVVDSVQADKDGTFSFAGIEPGSFQIIGAADGLVGGQAINVQPFAAEAIGGGGCSSCNVALEPISDAPCTTCGQDLYQSPASSCGCGSGGGGGGGLLGRGGGLLSNRRLLALGGIGGIIAIATSDDDDDDVVSPDN